MKTVLLITALESLVLVLLLVLWRFRRQYSKIPAGINANSTTFAPEGLSVHPTDRDASRWVFINSWDVSPQRDDRAPMLGDVLTGFTPTVHRSLTRRRHQERYKEWSQARHD